MINLYSTTKFFTLPLCHHYPRIYVIKLWDHTKINDTLFEGKHVWTTIMPPLSWKFYHYILGCHIHLSIPSVLCLPLLLISFAEFLTTKHFIFIPIHHKSPNPNYSNFNFTPIDSQIHITPLSHPISPIHKIFPLPSTLPNPHLIFSVSHIFTNRNYFHFTLLCNVWTKCNLPKDDEFPLLKVSYSDCKYDELPLFIAQDVSPSLLQSRMWPQF